jgi:hypothetical protein
MSAHPYVRELGMDEFVGAHHQTRSLFGAIDEHGHVETIDGVIVALIDVLIWHLGQQPETVRREILARFRQHLVDEIESAVTPEVRS